MAKPKSTAALKKTETLTLRLDPKMKFAIEMLARSQKRTLAGVIEWAISRAIAQEPGGGQRPFEELVEQTWTTDESTRFANMAFFMPDALTYDELRTWETIKATAEFWGAKKYGKWECHQHILDYRLLREDWEALLEHVEQHRTSPTVVPFDPPSHIPF